MTTGSGQNAVKDLYTCSMILYPPITAAIMYLLGFSPIVSVIGGIVIGPIFWVMLGAILVMGGIRST